MRRTYLLRVLGIALVTFLPVIWGCTQNRVADALTKSMGSYVTIPSSDITPPSVSLRVTELKAGGGSVVLVPGGQDYYRVVTKGETFLAVAKGNDPEGVQIIEVSGPRDPFCVNPEENVVSRVFDDVVGTILKLDSKPGDMGFTAPWTFYVVDPSGYPCIKGFQIQEVTISLRAKATNFHGLTATSPAAVFTYKP